MSGHAQDLAGRTCPELLERRDVVRICGRPVVAFIAPGHGRCAKHANERSRVRLRAILDSIRQTRTLRALPPEQEQGRQGEQQTQGDDEANAGAGFEWPGDGWTEVGTEDVPFDVDWFASAALDE